MSLDLTKGQRVDLTKTNPGLEVAVVGVGWDEPKNLPKVAGEEDTFDTDLFVLRLDGNGKLLPNGVVYFKNPIAPGISLSEDNRTGKGDGDDEFCKIDFGVLTPTDEQLAIIVNIYRADVKKQNFGMAENAFVRIYDDKTKVEILKFDLTEDYSGFNAVVFGRLYKKDGEWKFQAVGTGTNGDINQIADTFK